MANMFQKKTCNTLGFMEIIVYKIQPVGGWGLTLFIPAPNSCSIKLNHNLLHMYIKSSIKHMHSHQVKPDALISACTVTQVPMFYATRKVSIKSAVAQW